MRTSNFSYTRQVGGKNGNARLRRLNDCYRQQRFPYPGYASDVTVALGVYMGVNAKGAQSVAPALKR